MAKKKRSDLKEYFVTGKVPTQENFEDLVNSVPNFEDDLVARGFVFYPKNPEAEDKHMLAIYNKDPLLGGKILWSIGINKKEELVFYNADGIQRFSFEQRSMENCITRGQKDIHVDEICKYENSEITVKDDVVFEKKAKFKSLEVDELCVNKITPQNKSNEILLDGILKIAKELCVNRVKPNNGDEVSIEGVLKDIVKLVAKNIESDSIVTNNATVNNEITNGKLNSIKYKIDNIRGLLIARAGAELFVDFLCLIGLIFGSNTVRKRMGGNIHNVIGWLKKKLDDNPAMKEMIVNFDLKRIVEMVDCLDVIKDVNLQAIVDRNNLPKLIDKMGLSKLVEKSGVLDDSQRIVTLICKKNNEFVGETSHLYPIIVVTNKRPILLCAEHTQENAFEIYPTKYVERDANFKINWVDDHETDEKKLILESLSSNPDEYILYGIINMTDYAAVKEEFTIRYSCDMKCPEIVFIIHYFARIALDFIGNIIQILILACDAPKSYRKLTGGNIDISNVIGLLKKKLEDNPVVKEMIANYDLKKLVETVDCLNVIKNVNLQAMIDKNDFTGLIEKIDIFKLVGKNGVLDDSQRTATLIRKKNEEFASEGFHSYPIVVVTNKKPILLCANHTKENEFEVYPTKYAEGNEGFKLNWVDDHETDEKTLMLEYLSGDPDEYILYGMIKTDLA